MNHEYKNGISILRIISMYMVLILHFFGTGGVLKNLEGVNYYVCWYFECFSYIAVNLFALISGYCLYKEKFNYSKIVATYFTVFFYSVFITVLFKIIPFFKVFHDASIIDFIKSVIPICSYQYWYFTAYVILFLFAPFLNSAIRNLRNEVLFSILCILFVFFTVISSLFFQDLFNLNNGYSPLWLMYMYMVGAYIKKVNFAKNKNGLLFILFNLLFYVLVLVSNKLGFFSKFRSHILSYNNPFCFLTSVYFFKIFVGINVEKMKLNRLVNKVAASSFAVYLIHAHPLIFRYIISDSLTSIQHPALIVPILAFLVFILSILVDFLRIKLFQLLRLNFFIQYITSFFQKIFLSIYNKMGEKK